MCGRNMDPSRAFPPQVMFIYAVGAPEVMFIYATSAPDAACADFVPKSSQNRPKICQKFDSKGINKMGGTALVYVV